MRILQNLTRLVLLVGVLGVITAIQLTRPQSFSLDQYFPAQAEVATFEESTDAVEKIEEGIHVATGLVYDERFEIVRASCTACHSAKLITQNRMSRENWKKTIVWMQETQKLWDLGPNEDKILDYLAEYYAPKDFGRRKNLDIEEWYMLEL
ncbi:monoheme cytochrome C [Cryomorphaceae bacterium]|nr:monoheme cytochrome C [Cryomorphaceae bacterium]